MGACASKRAKGASTPDVEQRYDVLASLFATRAQDLANMVSEFEASKKAEAAAFEEAAELREQLDEAEARCAEALERCEVEVRRREEEACAYQRVLRMRTQERDEAWRTVGALRVQIGRLPEDS